MLRDGSKVDHIEGSALVRSADLTDLLSHAFVAKTRDFGSHSPDEGRHMRSHAAQLKPRSELLAQR